MRNHNIRKDRPVQAETGVHCSRQKLKTFQLFKCQRRHKPIRSPYANTLAQTLANSVHATPEN